MTQPVASLEQAPFDPQSNTLPSHCTLLTSNCVGELDVSENLLSVSCSFSQLSVVELP